MSFCSFSDGAAMFDVTPIENMFLLEYLPAAPDGFLRVYIYGRMLCLHPELGESLEKMAEALRMSRDEVLNAFSYWEQQGLAEKLTDNPPTYAFKMLNANAHAVKDTGDSDYYRYRWYNSALQDLFGSEHLLQPKQYSIANDWLNVLGFEQEAALRLLEYEYKKGRGKEPASVFRRADKRAVEWAERGIRTLADVEAAIEYDDHAYHVADRVLKQLSLRRAPTLDELNTVKRWLNEWGLSEDQIISGCAKTTASRTPSIAYLDAILKPSVSGNEDDYEAVKAILKELGGIGAVPTPDQCRMFRELQDHGFERDTILLAAAQCARKGKRTFDDLLWMINKWGDVGVHTYEEAEKYLEDMNRTRMEMHEVLKAAGLTRRPGADDITRYLQWTQSYPRDLILYAAQQSNGARVPIQYMSRLLTKWTAEGINTVEAAKTAQPQNTGRKPAGGADPMNYQQHTYTESDFGDEFYFDPTRDVLPEDN